MSDEIFVSHLSGGFDSAAVALRLLNGFPVKEIHFMYVDSKASYSEQERTAAHKFFEFLKNKFPNVKMQLHEVSVTLQQSQEGAVSAYVPVRNLVLGAIAINHAVAFGAKYIAVGNKTLEYRKEDPYCFKDCSREFYDKVGELGTYTSETEIQFVMPLVKGSLDPNEENKVLSKQEVIDLIVESGYNIKELWSCYHNGPTPCGKCYHCEEVKNAGYGWIFES